MELEIKWTKRAANNFDKILKRNPNSCLLQQSINPNRRICNPRNKSLKEDTANVES